MQLFDQSTDGPRPLKTLRETAPLDRRAALQLLVAATLTPALALLAGCGGGGGGGGGNTSTTVTGQVLDSSLNDAGVAGATITIGGVTTTTASVATTNNPIGSFTIQNASIGASSATITVAGGTPQVIAFSPSVAAGTNAALMLFINIGEVSGTVLLASGAPAGGAFISSSSNGDNTQANADGTFLLTNVPLGTTTLNAVFATESATLTVSVGKGVTSVGTIKLVDNPDTNPPGSPFTIFGKVTLGGTGGGAPASGAQVFLLSGGNQIEVTATDSTGAYYFYVPVGTYQLQFQANGYQIATQTATVNYPSIPLTVPTVSLTPQ